MSSNRIPWVTLAGATVSAAASYWLYESVSEYGWEGTMRYIWEGDAYAPTIREYMERLDQVEKVRITQEIRINVIEEALERARLDSVDDNKTTKEIVQLWIANYQPQSLEKSLSEMSNVLDRMAAKVDGILLSTKDGNANSQVWRDLKRRKKLLSKQLVLHMERCDVLMASYQVLQE